VSDLPDRPNAALLAKVDAKLRRGDTIILLSHDEIDEWRAQFNLVIPVDRLAYRGVPITEIGDGV